MSLLGNSDPPPRDWYGHKNHTSNFRPLRFWGHFPSRLSSRCLKLTIHLNLLPRLKIPGAVTQLPHTSIRLHIIVLG